VPDVWAGFYLQVRGIKEVSRDGALAQAWQIGLLTTELTCNGGTYSLRNREVLEAVHRKM
jgi:hypothetical protein